jgi:hypothetical protein
VLVITAGALDELPVVLAPVTAALDVAAADVVVADVLATAEVDADELVDAAELVVAAGAVVGVEVAPPQATRNAVPATDNGANRKKSRRVNRAPMMPPYTRAGFSETAVVHQ